MSQIQQLDPHVADLIAAGEVVERPASVVKELVENALDADAAAVVVEIRGGGMSLMRVTDDGCGIPKAELPVAFLRHATSKLRTAADLGKIGTLGFRGEALAAIAAVSRLDVLTRTAESETGASLHLEGGAAGEVLPAGAPRGTTFLVRDLFYNTPARLKFMKKDSAETAAVNGLMQHLALSHPEVSFKFIKDGAEALHTPGDGRPESAVYAALGREFAATLLPVEGRDGEIAVRGFVTRPLGARGSRGMQAFFVNGRFIKSQLLTAALEEGYRNQMMKGKFPGCVLFVTLPVTAVDVNVHPAKTQVKFAREHDVFDAVYHTVLDALDAAGAPRMPAGGPEPVTFPRRDFFRTMDAKTFRESASADGKPLSEKPLPGKPLAASAGPLAGERTPAPAAVPAAGWDTEWERPARVGDSGGAELRCRTTPTIPAIPAFPEARKAAPALSPPPSSVAGQTPAEPPESPAASPEPPGMPETRDAALPLPGQESLLAGDEAPWRIAGELLNTYIVCEAADETVWLIDKHAAHERVNFDRLQSAQEPPASQTLLAPLAAALTKEDAALLLENLPLLERFGFACEDFGDGALLVRAVPCDLDAADTTATLEEFAEKLRAGRSPAEKGEALLHTMACKAAVKAGMHSDERELRALVDRVQSGEIRYCPHGRPVAVKLTKYQLEKMFKRA